MKERGRKFRFNTYKCPICLRLSPVGGKALREGEPKVVRFGVCEECKETHKNTPETPERTYEQKIDRAMMKIKEEKESGK